MAFAAFMGFTAFMAFAAFMGFTAFMDFAAFMGFVAFAIEGFWKWVSCRSTSSSRCRFSIFL